jgi:hypothetical protein
MMRKFLATAWRDLVNDPEAICVLSLSNLVALVMLLILELWLNYGGR